MTIIIPAYNPDDHLINLLKDIKKELNNEILIVNDGSKKECNEIFDEANKYAKILIHEVNKGKGAAMKTAMKYIYEISNRVLLTAESDVSIILEV